MGVIYVCYNFKIYPYWKGITKPFGFFLHAMSHFQSFLPFRICSRCNMMSVCFDVHYLWEIFVNIIYPMIHFSKMLHFISFHLDVDECLEGNPCDRHASCINLAGDFKCVCTDGYRGDGRRGRKYIGCMDVNECSASRYSCPVHSLCNNLPGTYECVCEDGFEMVNEKCQGWCHDVLRSFKTNLLEMTSRLAHGDSVLFSIH